MTKVLSLDASTTTIGVSVLSKDDKGKISLDLCEYLKPPKEGALFERFAIVKSWVVDLIQKHKPDEVIIENFIAYMKASNAATIILLATFNRMIGMAVYEETGRLPKMINVVALRHSLKLTDELPDKSEIPELVAKHLNISFPYVYFKYKKKEGGRVAEESYDIADAIALGLGYLKNPDLALPDIPEPKKKKGSKKKIAKPNKKAGKTSPSKKKIPKKKPIKKIKVSSKKPVKKI